MRTSGKIPLASAIHAIAEGHRDSLAQQLMIAPLTAEALFGEIPEGGCHVEMVMNGDLSSCTKTLDVRIPDGEKGLRVTYAPVDYTASVKYRDGKSEIGVDAILSAMDYVGSKETQLETICALGIRPQGMQAEIEMLGLVKRCLIALREHAENSPAK